MKKYIHFLAPIMGIGFIVILVSGVHPYRIEEKPKIDENTLYVKLDKLPTVQEIYDAAKPILGKHAKLFVALKVKETGNDGGYAEVLRKHNNLVGMKMPGARYTFAIGQTSTRYAIYKNWFESLLDFKVYIGKEEKKKKRKTGKGFATDRELLKYMYGSYNTNQEWKEGIEFILDNFQWE